MSDIDFFTPGARLALELECLLLDTHNDAAQSRWWDSAHEALEQWRQAVRDMEAADAVQPEASTTLNEAESHAHICSKLAEQYKNDPVLFAALTDAAAIIRDLMRDRLSASAAGAGQAGQPTYSELLAQRDELAKALRGMLSIVDDSHGVAGYHLNGNVADWGEFEEVDAASAALSRIKGETNLAAPSFPAQPSTELRRIHAESERDEALLRQALEALERGAWDTLRGRNAAAAIRKRLGMKA